MYVSKVGVWSQLNFVLFLPEEHFRLGRLVS